LRAGVFLAKIWSYFWLECGKAPPQGFQLFFQAGFSALFNPDYVAGSWSYLLLLSFLLRHMNSNLLCGKHFPCIGNEKK
jgi:hypothetical protein